MIRCYFLLYGLFLAPLSLDGADEPDAIRWKFEEKKRFPAAEAHQGVAVDEHHFYAITNRAIGKYRKDGGVRVAGWADTREGRLIHLNAGVIFEGRLYCAHSNFPALPEESSIEVWDTATMRHVDSHRFESPPGSLTWIDKRGGKWFACFARYRSASDPALSRVMSFDEKWRPRETWTFPAAVISRFGDYSSSGGGFGHDGNLFVSGHDASELYLLDLPEGGGEMALLGIVPISAAGQAFAWDRTEGREGDTYFIQRESKEVIIASLRQTP